MQRPFPAYTGTEPYLFVCYAHADAPTVYGDLTYLRSAGFNVWYDEGIAPGSTWRDEVALALAQSSLVLYFASPASAASQNCQQELNFALSRELTVLRVDLEQTQLPPGLELALTNRQAIVRYHLDGRAYLDKLGSSVRRLVQPTTLTAARVTPAPPPDTRHAIAILPLANRSRDPDNEYLSDGITEELIAGLSRLDDLRVKSFLAVSQYKSRSLSPTAIGRELGVESIVSGSLQQAGARVRISVALTRVDDGQSLWSQHYDNDMSDIFTLQDDVARRVVDALSVELGSGQRGAIVETGTNNAEAYQEFLMARHVDGNTPRGRRLRIARLKRAVELDPDWVDGWGELANAYLWQHASSTEGGDPDSLSALSDVAERLGKLDPRKTQKYWFDIDAQLAGNAGTELSFDVIRNQRRFDTQYVRSAYLRLATRCREVGLYACGLRILEQHVPQAPYLRACLLGGLRRFDAAIESCTAAIAEDPIPGAPYADRCIWAARTGQYQRALADVEVLNGVWGAHHFPGFCYYFWRGDIDAARKAAEWLEARQRYPAIYKALTSVMLGDMDRALDFYEVAAQQPGVYTGVQRWGVDVYLNDSMRAALRAEPRCHAALAAHGVDDAAQTELIERINAVTPYSGIELNEAGVPI